MQFCVWKSLFVIGSDPDSIRSADSDSGRPNGSQKLRTSQISRFLSHKSLGLHLDLKNAWTPGSRSDSVNLDPKHRWKLWIMIEPVPIKSGVWFQKGKILDPDPKCSLHFFTNYTSTEIPWSWKTRNRVRDPDPHVFWPPWSGSFPFLMNCWADWNKACKIKFSNKILAKIKFLRLKIICLRVSYKKKYEKSISQRYRSADPDPHQNVTDTQHCKELCPLTVLFSTSAFQEGEAWRE